ncbi:MAG TPA: hypothetical protein VK563_13925 [Puia sp.]|nr:hypothetical protein [Puia sp.]
MTLNPALLSLFLVIQFPSQAQPPKPPFVSATLADYRMVRIRLAGSKGADIDRMMKRGFFSHFVVMDERMDTTRIGVHAATFWAGRATNRQLSFERSAAGEIGDYLNNRFSHPEAPCTALVVLRILWLTDANYIREDMLKDPDKWLDKIKIRLRAEIYAEKDNVYVPVLRYDSLLVSDKATYKEFGRSLADMLDDLADSSTIEAGKKWVGGRRLAMDDIRSFNQSRFNGPIFSSPSLTPGVYSSFADFRNNSPSITSFEIKNDKDHMLLYLKEADGQSYYSHNAWGYCDGTNVFIMKDGVLNPAWKEGNAWYFFAGVTTQSSYTYSPGPYYTTPTYGPGGMLISPGNATVGAPATQTKEHLQKHVFAIDMSSGDFY